VDGTNIFSYLLGMSPEQSRAARGWLGWSQTELAKRASVSLSTVRDFEMGHRTPIPVTIASLRRAIESAGIEFIEEEGKPVGIRLSRDTHGSQRGSSNPADARDGASAKR
jgi:ribosome-binding protein aMBF1 (putative translation factor)